MKKNISRIIEKEIKGSEEELTLIVELSGSPFKLEEELREATKREVLHFWSPGSSIGVLVLEGPPLHLICWKLGKEDKIIKVLRGVDSSKVIKGISSSTVSDPVMAFFKGKY